MNRDATLEALWKRQAAAERSSCVRPIAGETA
jgi:hypothetical protein